jgi:cell wall assembly regulator SMI1
MVKLKCLDFKGVTNQERVKFVESKLGCKFPQSYINCIKNCDGCTPINSDFKYFDSFFKKERESGIGIFLSLSNSENSELLNTFTNPPEFFPEGLVAFADTGGGDFICFDYRNDKNQMDPPVVYWFHEADIGQDVSFVAHNFEEFLSILEEPNNEE